MAQQGPDDAVKAHQEKLSLLRSLSSAVEQASLLTTYYVRAYLLLTTDY